MSMRAFARRAGVSDTFLRQCLAGRTEPTRTKLLAMAEAGGVAVEWLATGSSGSAVSAPAAEPSPVDAERLQMIIESIEAFMLETETQLTPGRRAALVASLYAEPVVGDSTSISHTDIARSISMNVES